MLIGGYNMPFVSQKQRAWAYTKAGTKALGGKQKYKNGKVLLAIRNCQR
jgi:hypothetical protein